MSGTSYSWDLYAYLASVDYDADGRVESDSDTDCEDYDWMKIEARLYWSVNGVGQGNADASAHQGGVPCASWSYVEMNPPLYGTWGLDGPPPYGVEPYEQEPYWYVEVCLDLKWSAWGFYASDGGSLNPGGWNCDELMPPPTWGSS